MRMLAIVIAVLVVLGLAGCGDCRVCQTGPVGNQRCRCYQPVEITFYRIAGAREILLHIDDVRTDHAASRGNPSR